MMVLLNQKTVNIVQLEILKLKATMKLSETLKLCKNTHTHTCITACMPCVFCLIMLNYKNCCCSGLHAQHSSAEVLMFTFIWKPSVVREIVVFKIYIIEQLLTVFIPQSFSD